MDQAKEKLKILLIHRSTTKGGEVAWPRMTKALTSFTEVVPVLTEELFRGELAEHDLKSFQYIFLDYSLADHAALENFSAAPLLYITNEAIPLEQNGARLLLGNQLNGRSCLNLASFGASDLARLLHLFLIPKRVSGVLPLLEKSALILGEKIQSAETIGSSLDRLALYLTQMESFELKARIPDLRQVLSAVLLESFRLAKLTDTPYPTVDFQVGVSAKKLVVNLRFRNTSLPLAELAKQMQNGTDVFWNQAWLCADFSLLTEHQRQQELEVMFLIFKPEREALNLGRSLLLKSLEKSGKAENLLAKPQDFTFQLLSDVRLRQHEVENLMGQQDEVASDIDLGSLPEAVTTKLTSLHEALAFSQDQLKKKESQLRETAEKLSLADTEVQQKRSQNIRLSKASQVQSETAKKRVQELERRIQNLQTAQRAERDAVKENKTETSPLDAVAKLEANVRVLEGEKMQIMEKFTSEQKRYGLLEQKYNSLFKDISNKDKEINDLKATTLKLRKENDKLESGAPAKATAGTGGSDGAKVKELELREQALKQELKKMLFKVENNEKNVKAIQNENAEKQKLLEQKLQAAKAKELELLKKVDELAAALKKVNKAA